jgi:hypothetical protein
MITPPKKQDPWSAGATAVAAIADAPRRLMPASRPHHALIDFHACDCTHDDMAIASGFGV